MLKTRLSSTTSSRRDTGLYKNLHTPTRRIRSSGCAGGADRSEVPDKFPGIRGAGRGRAGRQNLLLQEHSYVATMATTL